MPPVALDELDNLGLGVKPVALAQAASGRRVKVVGPFLERQKGPVDAVPVERRARNAELELLAAVPGTLPFSAERAEQDGCSQSLGDALPGVLTATLFVDQGRVGFLPRDVGVHYRFIALAPEPRQLPM